MRIVINPKYEGSLGEYVRSIPDRHEQLGQVVYKGRNTLFHTAVNGTDLSIKSFKVPAIYNRVAYTFFRKGKARRSYEHAMELLQLGIPTPEPVAYIETFRNGLLHRSYYVCLMIPGACDVRRWEERPDSDIIADGVARIMAQLHAAGVLHLDFTPGNILCDSAHRFFLIDINRMKFNETSRKRLLENFDKINENFDAVRQLALRYAVMTGIADAEQFADERVAAAQRWWKHRHRYNYRKYRLRLLKERLSSLFRHPTSSGHTIK